MRRGGRRMLARSTRAGHPRRGRDSRRASAGARRRRRPGASCSPRRSKCSRPARIVATPACDAACGGLLYAHIAYEAVALKSRHRHRCVPAARTHLPLDAAPAVAPVGNRIPASGAAARAPSTSRLLSRGHARALRRRRHGAAARRPLAAVGGVLRALAIDWRCQESSRRRERGATERIDSSDPKARRSHLDARRLPWAGSRGEWRHCTVRGRVSPLGGAVASPTRPAICFTVRRRSTQRSRGRAARCRSFRATDI